MSNYSFKVKAILDGVDIQEKLDALQTKLKPLKINLDLSGLESGATSGIQGGISGISSALNDAGKAVDSFRGKIVDTYAVASDGTKTQVAQLQTMQNGYNQQASVLRQLNTETGNLDETQVKIATDTAAGTSEIVRQGQAWNKLDAEIKGNYLKDLEYEGSTLQKNTEKNRIYQAELSRQGQAWNKLDADQQRAQDSADGMHSSYQKLLDQDYAKYIEKQASEEQKLSNQEANISQQYQNRVISNANAIQTLTIRLSGLTSSQKEQTNAEQRLQEIKTTANVTQQAQAIRSLTNDVNAASRGTNTFAASIEYMTERFLQITIIIEAFRKIISTITDMIDTVSSLDASIVELKKVTDLTGDSLEGFVSRAYDVGSQLARTGQEVVDAAAIFSRSGYDIEDALDLSKTALMLMNVGDNINSVELAATSLISILKGYNFEANKAAYVTDLLNEISNNAAINFEDLTEGLTRVSAVYNQAGVSIDKTSALLTGTNEILQNIEKSSSGLLVISQRLRGVSEVGSDGAVAVSKLSKEFKSIANINIFDQQTGQLRDTYSILQDMSKVWPTLTANQRQYLGELAAGF